MSGHDDLNTVKRDETKYGHLVDDDAFEVDEGEVEPEPVAEVRSHFLEVKDERDEIEKYNGLLWSFVLEDGTITAVSVSHYCPGPSHTDPMGFRSWDAVPGRVKRKGISALNGLGREDEIVDIEAVNEAAERAP